jgi:tRNA threonylcarbamoyladenosine biosynthesis protein TsaB
VLKSLRYLGLFYVHLFSPYLLKGIFSNQVFISAACFAILLAISFMPVNSMSNILVFDASSAWCSVALNVKGTLYCVAEMQPRKHAQLIMPMIEEVCQRAGIKPFELEGIAFGKGPGSFTGLRIAISVAQGLSLATGARLYGISSLKALAWQGMKQLSSVQEVAESASNKQVLAIMNAHMGEVFYGAYRKTEQGLVAVIEDSLAKPEQVDLSGLDMPQWVGAGDGFQFVAELPNSIADLSSIHEDTYPLAESMMALALDAWDKGCFTAAELQQPVYLRDTVAWKKLAEQPSLLKK